MENEQQGQTQEAKKSPILKIIGCGCIGLILVGTIIGIVGFTMAGKLLKNNAPYTDSIAAVQSNPAAIKALGEPIEPGWIPSGNISVENNTGKVDFSIGVSGPDGSGTIKVVGTKADGVWTYQTWHLKVDGEEKVIPLGK